MKGVAEAACRMSLVPAEADGRRRKSSEQIVACLRGLMMRMVKLHPMSLQYAADGIRAIPSFALSIKATGHSPRLR